MPLTTPEVVRLHGLGEGLFDRLAAFLRPMLSAATDVPRPDRFEARFYAEDTNLDMLCCLLDELPDGVTEIMSHPGLPDVQLATTSSYVRFRGQELEALTSPRARERAVVASVALISFAGLGPGQRAGAGAAGG